METENGRNGSKGKLVKALGIFSIALGAMELLMPEKIGAIAGMRDADTRLIRSYGVREIGAGVAILASADPLGAVISRVAGDALDLASLGKGFASIGSSRAKLAFATANVAAVTALDVLAVKKLALAEA